MDGTAQLLWGVLFGGIGFGFFLYGKKQKVLVPFLTGLSLIALPYLAPNITLLVIGGFMLMALPYFIKT